MEESSQEWKGYLIVREGPYWKIRNKTVYVGGTFTLLNKAKEWIDTTVIQTREKEFQKSLKRIRKIVDLKQRSKEYKKLCQIHNSL